MADDGSRSIYPPLELKRAHWQRLRRMYRSAGWPYLDAIELDLLAAGLLARQTDAHLVHLTEAGIEALAQQRKQNQQAHSSHSALISRMAQELTAGGRICYAELPLRVRLDTGWNRVRPDLFSIRRTSREDRLEPTIHEIKVRRSDLLADLRTTEKGSAYQALSTRCYYVLRDDIGEPDEVPEGFGVWMATQERLTLAREAPLRPNSLGFDTWMALAKATPVQSERDEQTRF